MNLQQNSVKISTLLTKYFYSTKFNKWVIIIIIQQPVVQQPES